MPSTPVATVCNALLCVLRDRRIIGGGRYKMSSVKAKRGLVFVLLLVVLPALSIGERKLTDEKDHKLYIPSGSY
ncbi:hypothetical protein Zm00014a_040120 [Zea mays]|uniref:Uncharacterized protein n=1 Tax=Zea mays TaxID=4577 RepID=A0A3L6DJ89_MAIZE|nr:hypothetical protein Zm00014a_040120 [Zea mays]